jgi:hypothetical protein
MPCDVQKYLPYLEGADLDEARKAEFIHSVWAIMESFADRAFGLHPVQQAVASRRAADSNERPDGVGSKKDTTTTRFTDAAAPSGRQEGMDHEGD